uniref:Uncharacterized protein n=1 Tax=Caenorhabditis tropicalis TaxID=1561998 RepID=A0A1I7U7B1_9PELO
MNSQSDITLQYLFKISSCYSGSDSTSIRHSRYFLYGKKTVLEEDSNNIRTNYDKIPKIQKENDVARK